MSNTPNNAIPYVPENTIDPAAGLNLALVTVDALLQAAVQSITNTPPGSPAEGERHLVGTAGTGDFAGHDNQIAQYLDGAWRFYAARVVVNLDDGLLYFRNVTGWAAADTGGVSFADITGSPGDNTALAAALAAKADAVQDSLSASVPPTVDNDETEGYEPRSRWFDIVAGESYLCLSAATGAAVWVQTSLTLDELGSAALADVGTADSELPTNLTVAGKITAWWNSITSAFGRTFVASADAAAGRTALGLGSASLKNFGTAGTELPDNDAVDAKIAAVVGDIDAALDAINGEVI